MANATRPPIIVPPQPQQRVNIQVVAKAEIKNTTAKMRIKLLRALADVLEAEADVRAVHAVVASSCDMFKQISLIGSPIDRSAIAGDEELVYLGNLQTELLAIQAKLEALTDTK
jgi:hypothetical protein